MKYKVSVIIPVYNAQDTIQRCIDSLINQTIGFSNIELILYDDNSKDDSRKILKEYSKQYDNIVLILSNENSGYPGKGRNEGIKRATADYVMFMDNDDEYREDMCETLYNEIDSENAGIVSSNYKCIDDITSKVLFNNIRGGISKNNKIIFLNDSTFDFLDIVIWNKIYKKSIIIENNVEFPEDKLNEDAYFNYLLLIYVNKIIYLTNYAGYIWHFQNESLSHGLNYDKIKGALDTDYGIINEYKKNEVNIDYSMFSHLVRFPLSQMCTSTLLSKEETMSLLKYIYSFGKEINLNDAYLDFVFKIAIKLVMKKKFNLAIIYLKFIRFCFYNKILRRIYRLIID